MIPTIDQQELEADQDAEATWAEEASAEGWRDVRILAAWLIAFVILWFAGCGLIDCIEQPVFP